MDDDPPILLDDDPLLPLRELAQKVGRSHQNLAIDCDNGMPHVVIGESFNGGKIRQARLSETKAWLRDNKSESPRFRSPGRKRGPNSKKPVQVTPNLAPLDDGDDPELDAILIAMLGKESLTPSDLAGLTYKQLQRAKLIEETMKLHVARLKEEGELVEAVALERVLTRRAQSAQVAIQTAIRDAVLDLSRTGIIEMDETQRMKMEMLVRTTVEAATRGLFGMPREGE